jgi:hypothetical protein
VRGKQRCSPGDTRTSGDSGAPLPSGSGNIRADLVDRSKTVAGQARVLHSSPGSDRRTAHNSPMSPPGRPGLSQRHTVGGDAPDSSPVRMYSAPLTHPSSGLLPLPVGVVQSFTAERNSWRQSLAERIREGGTYALP